MSSGFRVGACLLAVAVLTAAVPAAAEAQAGRLDPTFGERGRASTPLNLTDTFLGAAELGIAPDGSAVVAERGILVRFRPDGSRDRGFGRGGALVLTHDTAAEGVAERTFLAGNMIVDDRGRILVFGEQSDTREVFQPPGFNPALGATSAAVLRFSRKGERDLSFGGGRGFIREDFDLRSDLPTEIPLVNAMTGRADSQGRPVLVAGVASMVSGCYAKSVVRFQPRALVRLAESGMPDSSFGGGDGISPIEGSAIYPGLKIDGADRAVVDVGPIGGSQAICRPGTALLRFGRNGEPLAGFGTDGVRELEGGTPDVIERSGAMIVSYGLTQAVGLVRLKPEGTRDLSFGGDGSARVALPPRAHVNPVAIDGRGRILLAGYIGSGERRSMERPRASSFAVTRLLANGMPDREFGDRGWIFTPFARPLRLTSATAALDPRGRLLVAGTVIAPDRPRGGFVLARYLLGP
jgi:uncharacterized delta-60 repeat protein